MTRESQMSQSNREVVSGLFLRRREATGSRTFDSLHAEQQLSKAEASKKSTSGCRNTIVVNLPSHLEGHRDSDGEGFDSNLASRKGNINAPALPARSSRPSQGEGEERNAHFVSGILFLRRCLSQCARLQGQIDVVTVGQRTCEGPMPNRYSGTEAMSNSTAASLTFAAADSVSPESSGRWRPVCAMPARATAS